MTKFSLIITAGGTSSRYGNNNKLLEYIDSRTVIEHSVGAFLNFDNITEIIIPTNASIKSAVSNYLLNERVKIVEGGQTRQESVYNALKFVKNEYVIIHDGARPMIKQNYINSSIDEMNNFKGVTIGENSIVGAGSVVAKDIPDNEIWGGNPVQFIRKL